MSATPAAIPDDPPLASYAHTKWTGKDGLPGGVLQIAQTPDGYLWLETYTGLVRFDGVRFTRFETFPGMSSNTAGNAMTVARDGSIWVGLLTGGVLHLKNGSVELHKPGNGLLEGQPDNISEGRDGSVWLGTQSGLSRLEHGRWRAMGAADGLPPGEIVIVFQDRRGAIWAGTSRGLFRWHEDTEKFALYAAAGELIYDLGEDSGGKLWMATERGAGPVEPSGPTILWKPGRFVLPTRERDTWIGSYDFGLLRLRADGRRERFGIQEGLSNNYVWSLFQDREDNIWVGTANGLDRFRPTNFTSITDRHIANQRVVAIASQGNDLWVIASGHLFRIRNGDGAAQEVSSIGDARGLSADGRDPLIVSSPHHLWQYKAGQLLPLPLPRQNPLIDVHLMAREPDGGLWMVDARSGLHRWHKGDLALVPEFAGKDIFAVLGDASGPRWIGAADGLWERRPDRWYHYAPQDGMFAGAVWQLYPARDGSVWISGLSLGRLKDGRVRSYKENGLRAAVAGLVEDDQGHTWMARRNSITRYANSELEKAARDSHYQIQADKFFDESDGLSSLPGTEISTLAAHTADGRLWFELKDGVVSVDPRHMIENRLPPPVVIEEATADGRTLRPDSGLALRPHTRSLRIEYTALSLAAPEKVKFKIKLEGFDQDWVDPGQRREAVYTNLAPKSYRFRVMAANNDGVWNETGAAWEFQVLPAFYQSNWFLALCIAAAGSLLGMLYRLRMRAATRLIHNRYEERLAERTRIARELHDTLLQSLAGASLQLDAISKTMAAAPERAQDKMRHVRQQMDTSLREARQKVWDLRSPALEGRNLDAALRESLGNMTAGCGGFHLVVTGELRALPPHMEEQLLRIGQEGVANAIRHAEARNITLELKYGPQQVVLCVSDDGRGFDVDAATRKNGHWGLRNMQERAREIGAEWNIASAPGRGTRIETIVTASRNGSPSK